MAAIYKRWQTHRRQARPSVTCFIPLQFNPNGGAGVFLHSYAATLSPRTSQCGEVAA